MCVGRAVIRAAALRNRTVACRSPHVNGIGPETVDDLLRYAFNRSVFVIECYTAVFHAWEW